MLGIIQRRLTIEHTYDRNPTLLCIGEEVAAILIHDLDLKKADGESATSEDVHGATLYGIEIKVVTNKEPDYLEFLEEVC